MLLYEEEKNVAHRKQSKNFHPCQRDLWQYSYLCTYDLYCPVFLMRADPLRGQVGGGWALEIENFLGSVKWL
jgi:hypothetical protein